MLCSPFIMMVIKNGKPVIITDQMIDDALWQLMNDVPAIMKIA